MNELNTRNGAEKLIRVSGFVENQITTGRIAGAVTLVARQGKVIHFDASGLADIEADRSMEEDSIFRIYSMTKPVTSVAAMMLIEEGKLSLEDPISNHLPHFKGTKVYGNEGNHTDPSNPITVRHLLTHTSGLTYGIFGNHPVDDMYLEANIPMNLETTNEELTEKLASFPLTGEPGSAWVYGLNTDVLGHLVEKLSGKSLGTFFEERIFRPLDMKDTFFQVSEDKEDRLTVAYEWNEENRTIADQPDNTRYNRPVSWESGGAGLMSTALDYFRFCQMLLDGGSMGDVRLLSEETVRTMTSNQLKEAQWPFYLGTAGHAATTPLGENTAFGLGFRLNEKEDPEQLNGSAGSYNWIGYASTMFQIDPEKDLILIGLTQKFPTDHGFMRGFMHSVYNSLRNN